MQWADPELRTTLCPVLTARAPVRLAIVFGSCAAGHARADSDLDIAVDVGAVMSAHHKLAMIEALAAAVGRPVDLIDLRTCGEPVLGQILARGRLLVGDSDALAQLVLRHLFAQADFVPCRERILASRRAQWITP